MLKDIVLGKVASDAKVNVEIKISGNNGSFRIKGNNLVKRLIHRTHSRDAITDFALNAGIEAKSGIHSVPFNVLMSAVADLPEVVRFKDRAA